MSHDAKQYLSVPAMAAQNSVISFLIGSEKLVVSYDKNSFISLLITV